MNQNTKMYSSVLENIFNNSLSNLTDDKAVIKLALFDDSFAFNPEHDNYSQLVGEIDENNEYKKGGKELENFRVRQEGKLVKIMSDGVGFTNPDTKARYGVVYDDTPEDKEDKKLLAFVDFKEEVSPRDGMELRVYWENDCLFSFRDAPSYLNSDVMDLLFNIDDYTIEDVQEKLRKIILPSRSKSINNITQMAFPMFLITRDPKIIESIYKDKELMTYLFNNEVFVQYLTTSKEAMEMLPNYQEPLDTFFDLPKYVGEGLCTYDDKLPAFPIKEYIKPADNIYDVFLNHDAINLLAANNTGEFSDYIDIQKEDCEQTLDLIGKSNTAMKRLLKSIPFYSEVLETGIEYIIQNNVGASQIAKSERGSEYYSLSEDAMEKLSKCRAGIREFVKKAPGLTYILGSPDVDKLFDSDISFKEVFNSMYIGYGEISKDEDNNKTFKISFDPFDGEKFIELKLDLTEIDKLIYQSKNKNPGFLREEKVWIDNEEVYDYNEFSEEYTEHYINVEDYEGKCDVRIGGYCENNQEFKIQINKIYLDFSN